MMLQITNSPEFIGWLLQQAPVVVVMGAAIYWLTKRLSKAEKDKTDLAKEVIKLTVLWEEKGDRLELKSEKNELKNDKIDERNLKLTEEILKLLREIKLIVTNKR